MIVMLLGSVGTLFAFSWAANNKQFENLDDAAETIFDDAEPIGTPTDLPLLEKNDHGTN